MSHSIAMNSSVETIPLTHLAVGLIPAVMVVLVYFKWALKWESAVYALVRALLQLMLVGYFLAYIFDLDKGWVMLLLLSAMMSAAAWIALRTIPGYRKQLLGRAILALLLGGGLTLMLVTQSVLIVDPWYNPHYLIPLGGMIFANSMTAVSLAADRFFAELKRGEDYLSSRNQGFEASMIPLTNSLLAVGIVSLPGMMTGQILSGVPPLIAARYQMLVMVMLFGGAGISSAVFLWQLKPLVPEWQTALAGKGAENRAP